MKRLQRFTKIKIFRFVLLAVFLGAITLFPWLLGLPNADKFAVASGIIGLIITFWQVYSAMVKSEHEDFVREVNALKELFLRETDNIHQGLTRDISDNQNFYKEQLGQQQQTINYIVEKLNAVIIELKSHEQLPGHQGTTSQVAELRKEIAEMKAGLAVSIKQGEILNRIARLEAKK